MNALKLFLFRLLAGPYKRRLFRNTGSDAELRMVAAYLSAQQPQFIDVGANKGEFVYVASQVLPAQNIWAIEPLPYFARKLRALFGGVSVFNCVLSDHEGYTQFFLPIHQGVPDDSLASVTRPAAGEYDIFDVAVRTLDSIAEEKKLHARSFLKIDVEGHEFAVLNGGASFISGHVDAMLIEIEERHHAGRQLSQLLKPIEELGFICYYFHPQKKQLVSFAAEPLVFQAETDLNTPRYVNNFWFFAKHLNLNDVVGALNRNAA